MTLWKSHNKTKRLKIRLAFETINK